MRGASALTAWLAFATATGCEDERKAAFTTRERSQSVQTTATLPAAVAGAPAKPPGAGERRGALCGGRLDAGRSLPKKRLSGLAAANGAEPPSQLGATKGGFTWVNFWAAWCAPCKEEIPRLRAWEQKLDTPQRRFKLAFVSLDDDERQLKSFLEGDGGLRSTYWLKEGAERDEWMSAAGLDQDPELPLHLLVDSQGKIRCKVQGAVEDRDLPELVRLLESDG